MEHGLLWWHFPWNMVISHSHVNVFQRVSPSQITFMNKPRSHQDIRWLANSKYLLGSPLNREYMGNMNTPNAPDRSLHSSLDRFSFMGIHGIYPLVIEHSYGKSQLLKGKLIIFVAIYVSPSNIRTTLTSRSCCRARSPSSKHFLHCPDSEEAVPPDTRELPGAVPMGEVNI